MEKKPQYKVIVSDRARQMLAGHVRFLAQKSHSAARGTQKALMEAIPFPFRHAGAFSFSHSRIHTAEQVS